jgi:hypothetical protein
MEKIDDITDRDMDEIDVSNDGDLGYPPDTVRDFCRLLELGVDEGWFVREQELEDGEEYDIGVLAINHENPLGKLTIPYHLPFNEVIHFYDVFVATIYNISEEYHKIGEWMINRYLWRIKDRLFKKNDWNYYTSKKNVAISTVGFDEERKSYNVKDYIEFINDKGQEKFINFDLVVRLSMLYTVTPYQMEYFNSGKYDIKNDLWPDLSYYDPILNELGISKERVTGPIDYNSNSFSLIPATGFINHPYFIDRPHAHVIDEDYTKEDRRQINRYYHDSSINF